VLSVVCGRRDAGKRKKSFEQKKKKKKKLSLFFLFALISDLKDTGGDACGHTPERKVRALVIPFS